MSNKFIDSTQNVGTSWKNKLFCAGEALFRRHYLPVFATGDNGV